MINIITTSRYKVDKKKLTAQTEKILARLEIVENPTVNIVFVGKRKMRDIASKYKHEDEALPVLAFPYKAENNVDNDLLGEIFLCYPQVLLLAAERDKGIEETIENLIEHGIQNLLK